MRGMQPYFSTRMHTSSQLSRRGNRYYPRTQRSCLKPEYHTNVSPALLLRFTAVKVTGAPPPSPSPLNGLKVTGAPPPSTTFPATPAPAPAPAPALAPLPTIAVGNDSFGNGAYSKSCKVLSTTHSPADSAVFTFSKRLGNGLPSVLWRNSWQQHVRKSGHPRGMPLDRTHDQASSAGTPRTPIALGECNILFKNEPRARASLITTPRPSH
jgi:hypothetical protein